ncbi:coiled-coil domain-containing protein MAD1 [Lachancea thermotolerans CBS 6340]|uniref:Spindle assembly checkpoint component MAD1 n=1 Tax=Lachancea thermotolerans (strain ATCC 56472 / CBS 6340 / NRRL Y-8284) TaxID=559295 RepID=C5E2G5_LACTC|nr:KLTH0H04774p [Lachancea thermotolerans CBS 6340]CAR30226.1 KLTH0H04774p [Lachancea thermotolerans CBS 6340]
MSDSTGSSPFLERPMSPDSTQRHAVSLKYRMNAMQNEFEIEKLSLQRELSTLDKKYRTNLDELEKALGDTKYLYDTNTELESKVKALEEQLSELKTTQDTQSFILRQKLAEKERDIEQLRSESRSKVSELENKYQNSKIESESSKSLLKRYEEEIESQNRQLKELQSAVAQRDDEIASIKASRVVMAHHNYSTEELAELTTLNNLLEEQIKFSKTLEKANLEQANELKKLRVSRDSYQFLLSENERLKTRQEQQGPLERQVQDLELENINLQSQLSFWNSFSTSKDEGTKTRPEEIVKEWTLLKHENLGLVNTNSKLQLDINNVKVLNDELALERNQLLEINKNYETSILNLKKLNYEIEQQKLLSFEECKILRNQLDNLLPIEDNPEDHNKENAGSLGDLVENYKNKTEDLTNELKRLNEELMTRGDAVSSFKKRKTSDDIALNYSQRLNELQLENVDLNRKLTASLETIAMLETKVTKLRQLDQKKLRIMQLRDNPFSKDQLVKRKQLDLLLKENKDLLAGGAISHQHSVPRSLYDRLEFDVKQLENEIFKLNKKTTRLREVFNRKSLEFIEVVNSLLGFKMEFQSDGKVKMISCYKPEKYLVADLHHNSLKSNLQSDIDSWDALLEEFVVKRGQMPGFLASVTLQLWEKQQKSLD